MKRVNVDSNRLLRHRAANNRLWRNACHRRESIVCGNVWRAYDDLFLKIFFYDDLFCFQTASLKNFFCQNCLWDLNLKLNFRIFYSEINLNDETSDFCQIVGNRIQNMYFIKKFIKSLFWCVFLLSVKIKIKYSK